MTLTVTNLAKQLRQRQILTDINFTWSPGEIIGLVGRNGAGKTTLLRCLLNQYRFEQGQIKLNGQDLAQIPAGRQELIMVDPQHNFFKNYPLQTVASFYADLYPCFDQPQFNELLTQQKLTPAQKFRELSKGQQTYVATALAIISGAKFILLDEPFAGLDLLARERIVKLIIRANADQQQGFLIASHNLTELAGLATRVLFLKQATISDDVNLETFRQQSKKLQLVFRQQQIPPLLQKSGQIIAIRGRVIEVLFRDYTPAIDQDLQALDPVLNETLPLDLSDLFRMEYHEGKEDLG